LLLEEGSKMYRVENRWRGYTHRTLGNDLGCMHGDEGTVERVGHCNLYMHPGHISAGDSLDELQTIRNMRRSIACNRSPRPLMPFCELCL